MEREIKGIREEEFARAKQWPGEADAGTKCHEARRQEETPERLQISRANKERAGDSMIRRARQAGSPESERSFKGNGPAWPFNGRNGRAKSAKSTPKHDPCAEERRGAVEAYIAEVFEKTGKRFTRADIWRSARYKTRTEFERWRRNDPKATEAASERFGRLLKEKPHLK